MGDNEECMRKHIIVDMKELVNCSSTSPASKLESAHATRRDHCIHGQCDVSCMENIGRRSCSPSVVTCNQNDCKVAGKMVYLTLTRYLRYGCHEIEASRTSFSWSLITIWKIKVAQASS